MPLDTDIALESKLAKIVTSNEFDDIVMAKWYERIEALALDLIDEASDEVLTGEIKARTTVNTLEAFVELMTIIPLPEDPADSFVMGTIKTYVLDTIPLFHAYLIELLTIADEQENYERR